MKIGILTFHRAQNCGAMLQAWALANFLSRRFSVKAEVVDYGFVGAESRILISFKSVRCFLSSLKAFFLSLGVECRRTKKFKDFVERQMPLSCRVDREELTKMPYTHFFVGSDQVWNMVLNKCDFTYFIDFDTRAKRVAYAPSFGSTGVSPAQKPRIASALSKFDFLSVRESSAQAVVRNMCERGAEVVCDPTLLLRADDYLELEQALPRVRGGFVLLYTIGKNERAENIAKRLSRDSSCPLLHLQGAKHARWHIPSGGKFRQVAVFGPQEFIWCFRRAKYVVTNSFHGTAFSVINHRCFYSVLNGQDGDSRIVDFLNEIGLRGRVANLENADSLFKYSDQIDWTPIEKRLHFFRSRSIAYLRKALEK